MVLGDLEKQVLLYLWDNPDSDAKQVYSVLSAQRGKGSLNTIQSTLDRLFKKGLLSRYKLGLAYFYKAKLDREHLIAKLVDSVTSDFVTKGENSLIAAFASMSSELNDDQLEELEQLIEHQKQARTKV
ncbi:MAG: TrmB family transcriptional regulator [Rickettsiales bacterium]|jgi:predicted transcriptional regulator|nr:TrmB family transcriptional regulator [Rickettsiales bacterium]